MLSSIAVIKVDEEVVEGMDHLIFGSIRTFFSKALNFSYLKLEVLMMEPQELTAVILELVSNWRVLGEMGPDKLIPCVVPPE